MTCGSLTTKEKLPRVARPSMFDMLTVAEPTPPNVTGMLSRPSGVSSPLSENTGSPFSSTSTSYMVCGTRLPEYGSKKPRFSVSSLLGWIMPAGSIDRWRL